MSLPDFHGATRLVEAALLNYDIDVYGMFAREVPKIAQDFLLAPVDDELGPIVDLSFSHSQNCAFGRRRRVESRREAAGNSPYQSQTINSVGDPFFVVSAPLPRHAPKNSFHAILFSCACPNKIIDKGR